MLENSYFILILHYIISSYYTSNNKTDNKPTTKTLSTELHRPVIKKFEKRRVEVERIDEIFGADLVDMTFVEDENKPYKYIMSVIDCFSKYGWAYPIVNKKPETIIEVLKTIFKTRVSECLWVDKGTEFYNSKVKSFLSAHGVEL